MLKPILLIILIFAFLEIVSAQNSKLPRIGIVNGKAIFLPKPEYTKEAKNFCASGKVEIEVLIDENGDVISAEAISGDELLRSSAVEAVKRAKFKQIADVMPVKTKGIVVYNFVPERKCVVVGVVNERAKYLDKPTYPKGCRCQETVKVRIVIDMSGSVISARADSENPLLRISAVEAAYKTKFAPTLSTISPIFVVAFLEYKFFSNGKVSM